MVEMHYIGHTTKKMRIPGNRAMSNSSEIAMFGAIPRSSVFSFFGIIPDDTVHRPVIPGSKCGRGCVFHVHFRFSKF